jgi:hypothetical protein
MAERLTESALEGIREDVELGDQTSPYWLGALLADRDAWKEKAESLESALTAIRSHWREFGPEHGFDEVLERACQRVLGKIEGGGHGKATD